MTAANRINVPQFINSHKLSPYQLLILVLCFLVVAVDGFDTVAIGFIAPALRKVWHLSPMQLGPMFGAGLFGLMIGSMVFGPLADKFGRKTILVVSVALFGALSMVSALAPTAGALIVLRFLTGLGLGGAMPNAITMTSEYSPEDRRSLMVTTMFCGFTLGSALGGVGAAALVESFGWQSVLVLGGVLPLLLAPLLAWKLPESARYMVVSRKPAERIKAVLRRIAPAADLSNATFEVPENAHRGFPVARLFADGQSAGTLLLWTVFFMSLMVVYFLNNWLPTLIHSTGVSLRQAALMAAMNQVGSTVGALTIGWFMDRVNPQKVLFWTFLMAAAAIAVIGNAASLPWLVVAAIFFSGFGTGGSQIGANALAAGFYPTASRATGVAWALGVGRLGSVVGSMVGGVLMAAHLSQSSLFLAAAAPALLAALSALALSCNRKARAAK